MDFVSACSKLTMEQRETNDHLTIQEKPKLRNITLKECFTMLSVDWMSEEAARLRAMETRTGSVGDCSRLLNYRSNSRQNLFRRRSTRRRISNAQRLADLEDFINRGTAACSLGGGALEMEIDPSVFPAKSMRIFGSTDK